MFWLCLFNLFLFDAFKWLPAIEGKRPELIDKLMLEMVIVNGINGSEKWVFINKWQTLKWNAFPLSWKTKKKKERKMLFYSSGCAEKHLSPITQEAETGRSSVSSRPLWSTFWDLHQPRIHNSQTLSQRKEKKILLKKSKLPGKMAQGLG